MRDPVAYRRALARITTNQPTAPKPRTPAKRKPRLDTRYLRNAQPHRTRKPR